nr:hypothetical protein [uncultured Cupriavidus sp.]
MNLRKVCKIALALVAGAAMAAGGPTLAGGRGGGGGMRGGGMQGGSMQGGGFHGHDGFHHGHGHATFFVVGGGWPGWWWGYPYDSWPYPVAYPGNYAGPVQYIEKGDGSDGASANAWWYRCDQPSGYYPYVKDCPGGWQIEPAQPSS